ncbi:MAG: hypothetical protein QXX08_05085 [Candidatus Bathyarchaeia archaeon]
MGEAIESLRPFGYAAFLATLTLMFVGFAAKKWKLSTLGSISLFLPTFGYFAFTMFFLADIGIVRALWFPLIDSPLLSFGSIIYMPHQIISSLFAFIGIDVRVPLSFIFMEIGALIFFLGFLTWLYGRFKRFEIIEHVDLSILKTPTIFRFLTLELRVTYPGNLDSCSKRRLCSTTKPALAYFRFNNNWNSPAGRKHDG